jgi:hypothetical protein
MVVVLTLVVEQQIELQVLVLSLGQDFLLTF